MSDDGQARSKPRAEPPSEGQRCDFCGEVVPSVRRVALDGDYERLATRHQVQYACPRCSDSKERSRQGRTHRPG